MVAKGGPTDFVMISAEDYFKKSRQIPLKELKRMAKTRGMCETCGSLPKWRLGDTDMCFPCTTGEADASGDYELIPE